MHDEKFYNILYKQERGFKVLKIPMIVRYRNNIRIIIKNVIKFITRNLTAVYNIYFALFKHQKGVSKTFLMRRYPKAVKQVHKFNVLK